MGPGSGLSFALDEVPQNIQERFVFEVGEFPGIKRMDIRLDPEVKTAAT